MRTFFQTQGNKIKNNFTTFINFIKYTMTKKKV